MKIKLLNIKRTKKNFQCCVFYLNLSGTIQINNKKTKKTKKTPKTREQLIKDVLIELEKKLLNY